jgi:hypothetical protein
MKPSFLIGVAAIFLAVCVAGLAAYIDRAARPPRLPGRPMAPMGSTEGVPQRVEATDADFDGAPLASLPDLTRIDRRLREPAGMTRPRYCLLVFGPRAETRVWLIEDGERLYVDRNANGDLTEAGESFEPAEREANTIFNGDCKPIAHRTWTYSIGDVVAGKGEKHTELQLRRWQDGDEPAKHRVSVLVNGVTLQYAGWGPLFADSPGAAAVVHFGGPVVVKSLRKASLPLDSHAGSLSLCIGTPGLGRHSFAFVGCDAVPESILPVVRIAWPTEAGVVKEHFALTQRC